MQAFGETNTDHGSVTKELFATPTRIKADGPGSPKESQSKKSRLRVPIQHWLTDLKPKFDLHLKIIDLNNVPYVSGMSFIKWHLPHSAAAEHRGRTKKCKIEEHKVTYNYESSFPVRLVIDKNGMLQESWINFEVVHEVPPGGKGDKILLGNVRLNLAEYVEASEQEGEDGVCRRYLMQESKINSTLKISLYMRQLEGDRNFIPPPLRSAPVFSGIAGIIAGEQGDSEDAGSAPTLNSRSKEAGDELRELYRRTLAAEWTCQPGELSADKCIEDIFAGGDGWGRKLNGEDGATHSGKHGPGEDSASLSDSEAHHFPRSKDHKWSSGFFRHRQDAKQHSRENLGKSHEGPAPHRGIRGRSSFEHQTRQMKADAERGHARSAAHELDELDVRDDLRSWKVAQ